MIKTIKLLPTFILITVATVFGQVKKPNIVIVMADQWIGQATGYNGDVNVETPNLDELSAKSINFKNAVSVLPICTPYRAALLTGKYPTSTGMFLNDLYLPSQELTMAEIFKSAGYETGYIGKWHLDGHGRTSFIPQERRQGFDYWKANECTHEYNKSIYYANNDTTPRYWEKYDVFAQTDDAKRYITKQVESEKPFILLLAYGAPHYPHSTAPKRFKDVYNSKKLKINPNVPAEQEDSFRSEAIGYYAHCSAIDSAIGSLRHTIEELQIDDNTIFIFTADHGEMLGSHGIAPHTKQYFWAESSNVPFLLHYPAAGKQESRVTSLPISNIDILPTLLGLSNIKVPSDIEGEDISKFITGRKKILDRAVLIMNVAPFNDIKNAEFRGVKTSNYTYVKNLKGPWLLFNDEDDPFQMKNLIADSDHKKLVAELDKKLILLLAEAKDEFKPKEYYLQKYNYMVGDKGGIPFGKNTIVQSPQIIKTNK